MANVPQPICPTRNERGFCRSRGRHRSTEPARCGGRFARRLAVTSSYYDRFGARIKPLPGTGNAPDNLGRLSASLHWIMPGFGLDFSYSDARARWPGNATKYVEDGRGHTTIGP